MKVASMKYSSAFAFVFSPYNQSHSVSIQNSNAVRNALRSPMLHTSARNCFPVTAKSSSVTCDEIR